MNLWIYNYFISKQILESKKLSQLKSKSLSKESDYEDFPYNDFFVEATSQNSMSIKIPKDSSQGSNFDEFFDAICKYFSFFNMI